MYKLFKIILFTVFILNLYNLYSQEKYLLYCRNDLLELSLDTAFAQLVTREETGHNDGDVEKYLHCVGLSAGYPYCAAGQYYCFYQAALALNLDKSLIPVKRTALANSMFNDAKLKGIKSKFRAEKHDLLVWRKNNSYNGHIERIFKTMKVGWVMTIAFNTSKINKSNQSDGNGVFIKKRNIYYPLGRLKIRGLIGFRS
jgi:hypothetical protein